MQPVDSTAITQNGNQFTIHGGNLSGDGTNLFHHFEQFSLDTGEIANFLSAPNIQNILTRVVSGNPSIIDGLIQITGGHSHLYLINPAGILFGQNSSLSIPGDFFATTATGIGFGNNHWFDVFGDNSYPDLNGTPSQFAFDLEQHGAIINLGRLSVERGNGLTFLGGEIQNSGTLSASEGNITIAAVPGTSLVRISQLGRLLNLEIEAPRERIIRAVDLPQLLTGRTTGETFSEGEINTHGTTGGNINIIGDLVQIMSDLDASGVNDGGNIRIGGGYQGKDNIPNSIETFISNNATIQANALQTGNGGEIIIWSDDTTQFYGDIFSEGGIISGDGGFVEVSGKRILDFQGFVSTAPNSANGNYGMLLLDPSNWSIDDPTQLVPDVATINDLLGTILTVPDVSPFRENILESQLTPVDLIATDNIIIGHLTDGILENYNGLPITFDAGGTIASLNPLEIKAISDINFTAGNDILLGNTNITTTGNIDLNAGGAIATGNLTTQGGNLSVIGQGDFKPQEITTQGGHVGIQLGGNFLSNHNIDTTTSSVNAGGIFMSIGGDIQANALRTSAPALGQNGGSIWLRSSGNISLNFIETYASNTAGNFIVLADRNIDITSYSNLTGGLQGGNLVMHSFSGSIGQQNANVSTGSLGANNGGSISLYAHNGNVATGNLLASSANGRGGKLLLEARDILTGEITSTGLQGGGNVFLNASDNNIITESIQGGEISLISPNAIAINGTVTGENNLTFDTGILTIAGIDPNGNSILTHPGATISITSGTDFAIGQLSSGIGGTAGAIGWISGGVLSAGNFNRDTVLGDFSVSIRNPLPILTRSPPPAPIFVTPQPAPIPQQIARAFKSPLTVSKSNGITKYDWGFFNLSLQTEEIARSPRPLPNQNTASLNLTDTALTAKSQEFLTKDLATYEEINGHNIHEKLAEIETQTGTKFAIYYLLPSERGLNLILVLPQEKIIVKSVPISSKKFRRTAIDLAQRILRIDETYKIKAQQLYHWIIAPVEEEIRDTDAIAFIIGGELNSLPLAVLWDGEQHLIEKYALGLLPSLSLTNPEYKPLHAPQILAVGVSRNFETGDDLPAVEDELDNLKNRFPDAKIFLNETATFANFSKYFNRADIAHIATHGIFRKRIQYLDFWDKKATPNDIRQLDLDPIELLVLSSCEVGGGEEVELGFAGIALWLGARSVVASPVPVLDESTKELMKYYYENLQNPAIPTKVEAMQQAQMHMIGEWEDFSHPYYWANFITIGTPW
ncbi:MAG: CHAT domain-containing protein [Cyanobacteria bacterium SBLK]|nr:CHAT domain-containing protein [Cyanobacteria bacterium SBLK]